MLHHGGLAMFTNNAHTHTHARTHAHTHTHTHTRAHARARRLTIREQKICAHEKQATATPHICTMKCTTSRSATLTKSTMCDGLGQTCAVGKRTETMSHGNVDDAKTSLNVRGPLPTLQRRAGVASAVKSPTMQTRNQRRTKP